MDREKTWLAAGLLLTAIVASGGVCGGSGSVGGAGEPGQDSKSALDSQLRALVEAVRTDDATTLEEVTCLRERASAHAEREAQLGLVDTGHASGEHIDDLYARYAARVHRALHGVARSDAELHEVDLSEIHVHGDVREHSRLFASGELTESGLARLRFVGFQETLEVEAQRIGDRWCLMPTRALGVL